VSSKLAAAGERLSCPSSRDEDLSERSYALQKPYGAKPPLQRALRHFEASPHTSGAASRGTVTVLGWKAVSVGAAVGSLGLQPWCPAARLWLISSFLLNRWGNRDRQ